MLTVAVLGRVEVCRDGVSAAVPSGLTTVLLIRLALDAGRPVRADRLVDDLWPEGTRRNTLHAKVSQLRRALRGPGVLRGGPVGYTLAVEPGAVDALEALRLADEGAALLAAGDPAAAADTCRAGIALFGTEVLPAAGDAEWARAHRVRLEEARLRLTEDELAARMQLGASGEVTGALEALVAAHPLRERLWALLVTALYRAGRQSEALAAHRRVARLLAEELGVDPGPELAALERQVLTHDRALAPHGLSGNLPGLTAPLVGRTRSVTALAEALDAHRLVTITGPAGVGKTRLAVEVARQVDVPHGTWLVRLDTARAAGELPAAVAGAVPFADAADVAASLRGADTLLVVDNCEHLVDAVGALVTRVLDAAPQVRVLATGQRPLGLDGELVHSLGPLDEPDAVALFTQHASARGGAVQAGDDVARLCRALDHLPLAIELAAARARVLTVPEILARLDDRFPLLTDTAAGRPARRRSLAAALAWSHDLLSPDDRRGLWALAAFPDGATLPALAHVLAAPGVSREYITSSGRVRVSSRLSEPDIRHVEVTDSRDEVVALDVVGRLVERSLVVVDAGGAGPGGTRNRLLDSVRAFAREAAADVGVAELLDDAVVGWVRELAAEVAAGVRGPDQAALVARVAAERATVDAALLRARDAPARLEIAVALGWAWVLLDDVAGAARLRAAATPATPGPLRVRALLLESWIEAMSGDLAAARTALDAGMALAGDDPLADWHAGFVLSQEGRFGEALAVLDRCRAVYAARGCAWEEGGSVLLAAFAHLGLDDTAAGRTACEEAVRILTPLGDAWALLHAEAALGRVAHAEGRRADAARHHAQAVESARALGFPGAAALHRSQLGRAQHAAGDPAAVATLRRAAGEAERAGDLRLLAAVRVALAQALLPDDPREARELLAAADRWYAASGAGDDAALATELLATLGRQA